MHLGWAGRRGADRCISAGLDEIDSRLTRRCRGLEAATACKGAEKRCEGNDGHGSRWAGLAAGRFEHGQRAGLSTVMWRWCCDGYEQLWLMAAEKNWRDRCRQIWERRAQLGRQGGEASLEQWRAQCDLESWLGSRWQRAF
ncbi:hypothetical protein M0R45_036138 [Rubus argutus]|uniref:Uncharacterized protein n=1 Tax=Rubus argutus TaxID=59490 RepID=A0AAW1VYU0_RUBAR